MSKVDPLTSKERVYYNENDPKAAQWLQELMVQGHIPPGRLDRRSIEEVRPIELAPYTQCHFFAGIGGWPLALARAGIPRSTQVWTGSCPCQPFSQAGKGRGRSDERHLWPAFFHLIDECRPTVVFGEQVASKAGRLWLDSVQDDLEGVGYAVGAADLCAASVGAPHIRQRLYWVADSSGERLERLGLHLQPGASQLCEPQAGRSRKAGRLAYANGGNASTERLQRGGEQRQQSQDSGAGIVGHADYAGSQGRRISGDSARELLAWAPGLVGGFWESAEWIYCTDDKWRPVEPGSFPLAHGVPGRVGLLRGYGNAIVPQVAQAFIESYLEAAA